MIRDGQGQKLDVLVIGAGAAGLAALAELDRAGLNVLCLEARDRIGGRILTVHDPLCPLPIELGAEFVHGKPREIWDIVQGAGLGAYDCTENAAHIEGGRVVDRSGAWLPVDEIMSEMERAAESGPDRTFREFLAETNYPKDAKKLATSYVEGFNAAHDDRIGIASLAQDSRASEAIEGDSSFRLIEGYDAIPKYLLRRVRDAIRFSSVVERVEWSKDGVKAGVRSDLTGRRETIEARRIVVTVPLGVLQAGDITFDPEPTDHLRAAKRMCFGQVFRMILRFERRIWEENEELADAGFMLSDEAVFPTWWTPLPFREPLITGWSAGRKSDPLLEHTERCVLKSAIERLARITSVEEGKYQAALSGVYFHDWSRDPFARGAYSYLPVGGIPLREALASPLEDTLYFSGEATELNGHGATVHGAIASGRRAARQILDGR